MIDSYLRTPFQSLFVDPIIPRLLRFNISSHVYTWVGLAMGIMIVPALYFDQPFFALALLVLSGYFDVLDGSVARAHHAASPVGAVFDIVADRTVETAVIIGLYFVDPTERSFLCLLMLGSAFICVTSFLVVGIFLENEGEKGFHYSPGIMERTEAFLFFAFMIVFPSCFTIFAILFCFLVVMTACIRIWQFSRTRT